MKSNTFFQSWDEFLNNYQLYYRGLNQEGKMRFISRVESIYNNVQIIGKEDLEINDDIKILIISNLVQLTYGLKDFWLYGYEYLYIYPDAFYVQSNHEPVAGSTFQSKIIALSWKDFARDHLHAKDGKNISFSQFAKALVRTVFNGIKYDLKFGSYIDEWFSIIKKECEFKSNMNTAKHVLEEDENLPEIFARCVEIFFERPEILKKDLPITYAHLCCLLNQNPLNFTENYIYKRTDFSERNVVVPLPHEISINYKYKQWHWSYNLPLFGVSICPMIYYFIQDRQLIHTYQVFSIILMLGLICSIVFFTHLKSIYLFRKWYRLLAVSLLGFSPCLITLLLVLNQLYTYPFTSKISTHKIASFYMAEPTRGRINPQAVIFNFSDEFLIDFPKARTFKKIEKTPTHPITIFNEVKYEIRNGLIGIPILYHRETF
ncbi:MAG: zinc-dependent peptidase [Bacteroidia bacterium]|nr:zinc-dependent peptidase [Bacteroidia bacterium]